MVVWTVYQRNRKLFWKIKSLVMSLEQNLCSPENITLMLEELCMMEQTNQTK